MEESYEYANEFRKQGRKNPRYIPKFTINLKHLTPTQYRGRILKYYRAPSTEKVRRHASGIISSRDTKQLLAWSIVTPAHAEKASVPNSFQFVKSRMVPNLQLVRVRVFESSKFWRSIYGRRGARLSVCLESVCTVCQGRGVCPSILALQATRQAYERCQQL